MLPLTPRRFLCLFTTGVLLALAGCRTPPPTGEVSGKVTFEGKPVKEGRVTFQSDAGTGDEALLNEDGTFAIKKPLPVGDYKVMVQPLVVKVQKPREPEVGEEKPAPDIPTKYRTLGATELKAKVVEGKNELTFDMKR